MSISLRPLRVLRITRRRRPVLDRGVAWLQLIVGLAVYGLAVALMIRAGLGLGPWDAFHVGLHVLTGMSVGVASIVVGLMIVVGSYFIGVRAGAGTLANMVLIGVFIDLIMPMISPADGLVLGLVYFMTGVVLCALATGMYIAAGLGKGPRDGLMLGISQRMSWRVGRVRTGIEIFVLLAGWAMGGMIGLGTILFAAAIGPATQWGLSVFGISSTGAVRLSVAHPRIRKAA
jgi:uncharacterized protein